MGLNASTTARVISSFGLMGLNASTTVRVISSFGLMGLNASTTVSQGHMEVVIMMIMMMMMKCQLTGVQPLFPLVHCEPQMYMTGVQALFTPVHRESRNLPFINIKPSGFAVDHRDPDKKPMLKATSSVCVPLHISTCPEAERPHVGCRTIRAYKS